MTYTATTINDATHVIITDPNGTEILTIPVGLISEDKNEWEREVDEHLAAEGFTRTGPWTTNTAPLTPTTLFIASSTYRNETETRAIILDSMGGYERDYYAPAIANGEIDNLVNEEWENVWTQGDGVFTNETEAREYVADENEGGRHLKVIEITRDDVRAAIIEAFGAPANYPIYLHADNSDPLISREAARAQLHYAREIASDDQASLLELENGIRVIKTNADPIWEEDDAEGFAAALAQHDWADL